MNITKESESMEFIVFGVFVVALAAVVVLLVFAPSLRKKQSKHLWQDNEKFMRQQVMHAKQNLVYFEDERTGLCYAYVWGGDSHGGPALTLVPKENVAHLLIK